ncbi:MAG: RNase J family beta-CASP ribonuclease [Candidatus Pacearchaeota archaeon]
MLKIHTIGGYNEVGKNMTAVEINEDIIVFDCGLYLPAVIDLQENERYPTPQLLRSHNAIPDDSFLIKNKNRVKAFVVTHAHLDHIGALHYIAQRFPKAHILTTPFSIQILKELMKDAKINLRNKIIPINPDNFTFIKGNSTKYKIEFLNITHSTIQSTIIALHTLDGIVIYANDYKFDNTPIIGRPPNYNKFRDLAKVGIKVLIADCLYAGDDRKTNSEKIARAMVEEALLTVDHGKSAIIISTFSSHIARLKSIVEYSKKLNREIVFMGRSLAKYINASRVIKMCPFENEITMATYKGQLKSYLKKIELNRNKYVIVCTGHQGEKGSILDRIVNNKLPFSFRPGDAVIFSSKVIPTAVNISHRAEMDKKLKQKEVRIFDNVHVSGHGGKEDLRELINILKPKHFIPSHGGLDKTTPAIELAKKMGYSYGKTAHLCQDGSVVII